MRTVQFFWLRRRAPCVTILRPGVAAHDGIVKQDDSLSVSKAADRGRLELSPKSRTPLSGSMNVRPTFVIDESTSGRQPGF